MKDTYLQKAIDRLRLIGEQTLDDPGTDQTGRTITHIRLESLGDVEQMARLLREQDDLRAASDDWERQQNERNG